MLEGETISSCTFSSGMDDDDSGGYGDGDGKDDE